MEHKYVGTRLSIMMFLQFFVWGAWFVTVGNFMASAGMSADIHWAYTVGPIAAMISPFFLGMVADRFFAAERVLATLHIVGGVFLYLAPSVVTEGGASTLFIVMILLHSLCYYPTLGLINTLSFHNLSSQEKQFPIIRVFGTIGWIAANWVVSKYLHADTEPLQFWVAGGASIALGVYCLTLPHTPPASKDKASSVRDVLGLDALQLLKSRSFVVFIVSSFLICIPLSAYYAYAPVFAGDAGVKDPAYEMSFGQISEIFFMLIMPLCFARLGVKKMLLIGMLAWAVRYGLFAGAADEGVRGMIFAGILLHGICYDFFFVTGQIYVDKKAPTEIRGQAQGFLVLVTLGLGMFIGAQVAGNIFNGYQDPEVKAMLAEAAQLEKQAESLNEIEAKAALAKAEGLKSRVAEVPKLEQHDWRMIWLIPAVGAGVVLIAFAFFFRDETASGSSDDSGDSGT